MTICVIPARGGSKRVPRKNIRQFFGDPIIRLPIRAALQTRLFDLVIVSTEDDEIGRIAESYGATWLPRSPQNATDRSGTRDVLVEVASQVPGVQYVCEIYATAALVSPSRIREGYDVLRSSCAASTRCVTKDEKPAWHALRVSDGRIGAVWPGWHQRKTQEVGVTYSDAGTCYWFDWSKWDYDDPHRDCAPIIVRPFEAQDLDTIDDVLMAELKYFLSRRSLAG